MRRLVFFAALAVLSACTNRPPLVVVPDPPWIEPQTGWRAIMSSEDVARLDRLPETWRGALAASARFSRQIQREGDLLVADAARDHPALPPGSYQCRLVKLGTPTGRDPAFRVFADFFCYVRGEGDRLYFTKQTGTERPEGWLHPDGSRRLVLTGAKQQVGGGETIIYGSDPERDLVGVVERVSPFRWRLVLPWRGQTPGLDVYELIPVPVDRQAAEPRTPPGTPIAQRP